MLKISRRKALQRSLALFTLTGEKVAVSVITIGPNTVRITAKTSDSAIPSDGALVKDHWGKPATRTGKIRSGNLTVSLNAAPFSARVYAKDGHLVQELQTLPDGSLSFLLGDAPVLGLGQGGPQFDRRGHLDAMISGQGGYHLRTHGGKVPIQFLIGTAGWAMFVHAPLGAFDLTQKTGRLIPASSSAPFPLDIFVIAETDPAAIMREYAKLTGYPELPPLWSFGYQQSHRTLGTPEEILREAKIFREKKLPCDAMIYLGTEFCPNGWNTRNGEFTWNPRAFPDPPQAIQQLHASHFKVVAHIAVEGHRFTGTVHDPCRSPDQPPGRTPDDHWPANRPVSCYWPAHKPLMDIGIDGWWPDQGDDYDAPSRLARNRMYFDGALMYRPNERVFALHRNGYAGMQRYASFLWSGDVQSTWETLKTHVPVAINTGLSGIPFWGTDIGGFVPTQEYTGELFLRWFQFATFNPLFRSHGRQWRLHLPWGWTKGELGYIETPSYHPDPKELDNPAIEPFCKKYLELRYQLLPYIYSAVKTTCETGLPIIRALWLHYADDPAAVTRGDQFLFGRDLLVAPVVEKAATFRTLYLPRGDWYDFWSRERLTGGREITRAVNLETTPLFVRAGAILPLGPIKQYTDEPSTEPITLWVYPGIDGAASLYEDDGHTFNYRNGEFMKIEILWNNAQRELRLRLASGSRLIGPSPRKFIVREATSKSSAEVTFTGLDATLQLP